MSRPVYDIEQESDGWWTVIRNGGYRCESFTTRDQAEAAIHSYELEDEEAEQEACEQDDDEEYGARADFEYDRNR